MVLGAPLLLTGEPGCGKTQFAWAAAQAIGRPGPLICSLRSDRRARDWFYYYDAERRMADAQSRRTERQDRALWPHFYIELRPLGKALMSARQEVVLIDEIDKAPKDLFDDLWWQLDQGSFEITEIGEETPPFPTEFQRMMKSPPGAPRPLIVITCNGERQLPLRFMRRCIIHNILFPAWHEGEVGKSDYTLLDILRDHFNQDLTATPSPQRDVFYRAVLTVFMRLRTGYELTKRPSTAELLDWTKALLHHGEKAMAEVQRLAQQPEKIQFVGLPGIECLLRLPQDLQKVVAWPSTGAQPGFRAHPTKA